MTFLTPSERSARSHSDGTPSNDDLILAISQQPISPGKCSCASGTALQSAAIYKKVLASDQYQKSDLLVHKLLKVWEKNLPTAGFMQLHPRYVEIEDQVPPLLAPAIRNEVSVQKALTDAEQLVNNLLGQ